jgi:hypothetical protein
MPRPRRIQSVRRRMGQRPQTTGPLSVSVASERQTRCKGKMVKLPSPLTMLEPLFQSPFIRCMLTGWPIAILDKGPPEAG